MGKSQFVACSFKPGGRHFTYENKGDPVAVGDRVRVPAPRDDGFVIVTVEAIATKAPPFACKEVLGLAGDAKPEPDKPIDDLLGTGEDRNAPKPSFSPAKPFDAA
jgi:hypothetical protein